MGGGRRLAGELAELISSSSDASSSDESQITELRPTEPCEACLSAFARARALLNSRDFIRRYKPGYFIDDAAKHEKFEIPETTTLLLIGGSGKSTLISKIKSVFDDVWSPTLDNDEALDDSVLTERTSVLQEHMILKDSKSICIVDTPVLSSCPEENYNILKKWMRNGFCHGEMGIWDSVSVNAIENNKTSVLKECEFRLSQNRMVNYVILVLDAVPILRSIDKQDTSYMNIIYATFNYPFLSCKDNKPAVVVTNRDQVSSLEFSRVLDSLKELLGIPCCQIFSIPGTDDYHTELSILSLLRYCVEKADQSLPLKQKSLQEKQGLEHAIWKAERYFGCDADLAIDVLIVFLCFIVFLHFISAMGFFPSW